MRTRLDEICLSIADGDHQAPPKSTDGIPFITISCMDPHGGPINFESAACVPEEYYSSLPDYRRAKAGDVLLSVVGSLGIPYLVKAGDRFVFQRHVAILRPSEKIMPEYLYYLLMSPSSFHYIDSVAQGAAQRTLTLTQLRAMEVDIPSLDEQGRIVGILMAYDNLIENNRRQIALLEEAAQRLYKEWFVFCSNASSWSRENLLSVADIVRGRSYTSANLVEDGSMRLVNLNNIRAYGGWADGADKPYSGEYKHEQVIHGGDILMAVTDMTKERRLVGHVAITPKAMDGAIISMDLLKLVPKKVDNIYLYATLRFSGLSDYAAMLANGTNVLHLKPEALVSVDIPIAPVELQERYCKVAAPILDKVELLRSQILVAQEARDRLLPKLMSPENEG